MEYRFLGKTGLRVSVLSFGSWVTFGPQVNNDVAYNLMTAAYRGGVNFFDNAETYENGVAETLMGEAVKRGVAEGVWERDDLVLSTKIFFGYKKGPNNTGLSRKHIVEGTKASLKRMGLDYVDLLFCHRPDPLTPMEETVRAMNFCIDQGWAFYWGTSEWSSQEVLEACAIADRLGLQRPVMDQPQYNMFERERVEHDYLPLYAQFNYGTTIWSPLASGILSGKYSKGQIPAGSRLSLEKYSWLKDIKLGAKSYQIDKADELRPIAERLGCTLSQLALAWCVANKNVSTVIMGASNAAQLQENLDAIKFVAKLDEGVMSEIDGVLGNKPQKSAITQQALNVRAIAK